jgi:nucleotide-binding universal stress UspA family protein
VAGFRRFLADDAHRKLRELVPSEAHDWCRIEEVVTSGKPYAELLRLADELRSELIVMGVRGRGTLDLALFGSTTNQVVRAADCPVLTVPEA